MNPNTSPDANARSNEGEPSERELELLYHLKYAVAEELKVEYLRAYLGEQSKSLRDALVELLPIAEQRADDIAVRSNVYSDKEATARGAILKARSALAQQPKEGE